MATLFLVILVSGCGLLNDDPTSPTDLTEQPEPGPDQQIPTASNDGETTPEDWDVIEASDDERVDVPDVSQELSLAGPVSGPDTLDPALVRDSDSAFLVRQVFRGLVKLDADLEPVPDLAEQIGISPDRTVYRFTIRDGARFHDGQPITAEDVRASLLRATDPLLTDGLEMEPPSGAYLNDIVGVEDRLDGISDDLSGVEVVDERTIDIKLDRPSVDFLTRFSSPVASIVDTRETDESEWWRAPNGSGPFRVARFDSASVLELTRHDDYKPNPAYLARVNIRLGRDAVNPFQLYEAGEIDITGVAISLLDRVAHPTNPLSEELRSETLLSTRMVYLNPNVEPLDDQSVREALIATFPRSQVANASLNGYVESADRIIPPGLDSEPVELPAFFDGGSDSFDIENSVMDERSLRVYSSGGSNTAALEQIWEDDLGIQVDVYDLEWSDFLDDLSARRLPIFEVTWISDYPDPLAFLYTLFHSNSSENFLGYQNESVDSLLDEAAIEGDTEERAALLREAEEAILSDAVVMPLYFGTDHMLIHENVAGLSLTPMGILGLEDVWIRDS